MTLQPLHQPKFERVREKLMIGIRANAAIQAPTVFGLELEHKAVLACFVDGSVGHETVGLPFGFFAFPIQSANQHLDDEIMGFDTVQLDAYFRAQVFAKRDALGGHIEPA